MDGVGVLTASAVPADVFAADLEVVVHRVVVADEFGGPRREPSENFTALERQCTLRNLRQTPGSFGGLLHQIGPQQHQKGHLFSRQRVCAMGSRFGG